MNRRRPENDPRRGEVWSADLGYTAKRRPVVIISRDDSERPRRITIFVPITSHFCGSKYEVELQRLPFLTQGSTVNLQGINSGESADEQLFLTKLGDLPPEALAKIEQALLFAVGMAR